MDITKLQIGFEEEFEKQIFENIYESAYANSRLTGWGIGSLLLNGASATNFSFNVAPAY